MSSFEKNKIKIETNRNNNDNVNVTTNDKVFNEELSRTS